MGRKLIRGSGSIVPMAWAGIFLPVSVFFNAACYNVQRILGLCTVEDKDGAKIA
jgi:hypothetical protein